MGIASQAAVSDTGQTASTVAADDLHLLARSPHDGLKQSSCFDSTTVLPSLPAVPLETCPATTPLPDDFAHYSSMNLIVGGALAPVRSSPPRQSHPRPHPGLRLPSFEALGIAAPHPDRFGRLAFNLNAMNGAAAESVASNNSDFDLLSAFNATQISPMRLRHPLDAKIVLGSSRTIATPIRHDVATLTPPAETGEIQQNPIAAAFISHATMDSPAPEPGNSGSHSPRETEQSPVQLPPGSHEEDPTTPRPWIAGALDVVLANLRSAASPGSALKVLSHALPSPSPNGHVYTSIVGAIHSSTPAQPTVWINLFHAIQGRFNLADLPNSPPSTPGPPIGGDDYFTQKVFDSAVSISDYSEDLSSLPRSPRPIVPPSSIDVSVVERYIPPTSSNEFANMFNPNGPSILVDRLVELSPNNGSLVFIYPTRRGAETFMREYLGPILEPLLRSLLVVNNLSSELGTRLGTMAAAGSLPDYDQLHRSMSSLCSKLTQRSTTMQRFHDHKASFSLVHASKEEVHIDRETWLKEWWVKQEKPRIREAMTKYIREAQKKSSNQDVERAVTSTELIQQLLDGVSKRPYPSTQDALRGIEVSVFVIKRSS
ncbi:hypothetical protein M409DRAFT_19654 [Zasmidium cellare ATCC 36951]|uniref:Uncharacterized protein n=1 Tax=Zasmidium cellare ATCC 36951 TaxID=1080233 RepID=A0A6A6CW52_ZASCE|nr:uncharacterized protein M409DRAFT_19654 [Zasmidium cellare ATCC 36951]KAF2170042.1 hypothetical protein M409DRAFT_19654 [Zasmidium cellare ATCC 36951]